MINTPMYRIEKYNNSFFSTWNNFIETSKNGTFLFHRDFMEYHADRFEDYSLLVFDNDKLLAVLPANKVGDEVHSHDGLTYGGLVLTFDLNIDVVEYIYNLLLSYLRSQNIKLLKIKPIPVFYDKADSSKERGVIKTTAKIIKAESAFAIDYRKPVKISSSKLKHFRKISKLDVEARFDNEFNLFWSQVLVPRLQQKYNATPVHTIEEIKNLHQKFPNKILQYNVYFKSTIVAGITLFDFGTVVKSQYGATTALGEKVRALDYAYITLIEKYKDRAIFFDMGTVKPDNTGLANQKLEFGCSIYPQDFYEVETKNYNLLDSV